jgi:hypothetical protein
MLVFEITIIPGLVIFDIEREQKACKELLDVVTFSNPNNFFSYNGLRICR